MGYDEFSDATLLVVGGSGFLGRGTLATLTRILPRSTRLVSLSRRPPADAFAGRVQMVAADIRRISAYEHLLAQSDYVIWMAADRSHSSNDTELYGVNVEPLESAMGVVRKTRRLRRFIYVSSLSAVDHAAAEVVPIDDDSPPAPQTPYGRSKLMAEGIVLSAGIRATVLRLAFLYGPGYAASSFLAWYRRVVLHPIMSHITFTANLSLLHTHDFGHVAAEVLKRENDPAADLSPYVVSDGVAYEVDRLVAMVAQIFGKERARPRTPVALARLARCALAHGKYRYWRHAAFTRDFFVVNPTRFQAHFPKIAYTPILDGLTSSYLI